MRLAPLLFVRPGELRKAEWSEFNFETAEWRIPAEKMAAVLTNFLAMYNTSKDTGISALIKAGVASLDHENEINYVIAEIHSRTGKNPKKRL